MTDFDPRYQLPRRSLIWPTLGTALTLLIGVAMLAGRCEDDRRAAEDDVVRRDRASIDRAIAEMAAARDDAARLPGSAGARAATAPRRPADLPAEFEVSLGDARADLTGARMTLGDHSVEITPTARWTLSTPELTVPHEPSVRAIANDQGAMLATADATALIVVTRPRRALQAELDALEALLTASGRVIERREIEGTVAGVAARGVALTTAGRTMELFIVRTPRGREVRAQFTAMHHDADLTALHDAVAATELARRPQQPAFVAVVRDGADQIVGRAELQLDRPVDIAGQRLVVRRRATIRTHLAEMTFEHPPALVATLASGDLPSATLTAAGVAITLIPSPTPIEPEAIMRAMQVSSSAPVTRVFDGATYAGLAATVRIGGLAQGIEYYAVARGGRHFLIGLVASVEDRPTINRLAAPVFASLR